MESTFGIIEAFFLTVGKESYRFGKEANWNESCGFGLEQKVLSWKYRL